MDDYKKMYYTLFNKMTDIIYELQIIQRTTEEMCPRPDREAETAGEPGHSPPRNPNVSFSIERPQQNPGPWRGLGRTENKKF